MDNSPDTAHFLPSNLTAEIPVDRKSADKIDKTPENGLQEGLFREEDNEMKQPLPKKPPQKPETMSIEQVCGFMARSGIELGLNGDALTIKDPSPEDTPEWLAVAIVHHEAALVKILHIRKLFRTIDERTCLMRFENPPKGTREEGLRYIGKMLAQFADMCDLPEGYTDPGDIFADCALDTLRHEFEELTRPDAPYPVPRDDPRERYPNGKLMTG
jgi:hypothetical protein